MHSCSIAFWEIGRVMPASHLHKVEVEATLYKLGYLPPLETYHIKKKKTETVVGKWRQILRLHGLFLMDYFRNHRLTKSQNKPPCWSRFKSQSRRNTSGVCPIRCSHECLRCCRTVVLAAPSPLKVPPVDAYHYSWLWAALYWMNFLTSTLT